MTVKDCTSCKRKLTSKDITPIGRMNSSRADLLLGNCKSCNSTIVIRKKKHGN